MNPVRPHYKELAKGNSTMNEMKWFYIYVLNCNRTNTFYTGATVNLEKRLEQHNKGKVFYTKSRLPVKLIYFEACLNKDDAYRRERYLKTGMGKRYLKNRLRGGLTG
jgi:putative endonuclease